MPNYYSNQHPYTYAQYTQPNYTPDFQAGQASPNYQVPFPAHNGQSGAALATPIARPKHFSRNTHTTNDHLPYKSALKNANGAAAHRQENGVPVNPQAPRRTSKSKRDREELRGRTSEPKFPAPQHRNSSTSSRWGERSVSRQRTNSKTRFIPGMPNPRTGMNAPIAYILIHRPHICLLQE